MADARRRALLEALAFDDGSSAEVRLRALELLQRLDERGPGDPIADVLPDPGDAEAVERELAGHGLAFVAVDDPATWPAPVRDWRIEELPPGWRAALDREVETRAWALYRERVGDERAEVHRLDAARPARVHAADAPTGVVTAPNAHPGSEAGADTSCSEQSDPPVPTRPVTPPPGIDPNAGWPSRRRSRPGVSPWVEAWRTRPR